MHTKLLTTSSKGINRYPFKKLVAGILFVGILSGFSCHFMLPGEGNKLATTYFWTRDAAKPYRLYIDNAHAGMLPFIPDSLTTPGNTVVKKRGLQVIVKPGSYAILVKDDNGEVVSEGKLSIKLTAGSQSISSSWNNGKCKVEVVINN